MRITATPTIRPSRRVMFAAAAVLVGLSACGDAAVPSAGSLPVIELAGSSGKLAAGATAAESMDSRMMMPMYIDYVWAGDDGSLPISAPAFRYVGTPTAADAQRLADALGIDGDVVEQPADMGGGWVVGPNDGTAPSLTLVADGLGSWWYSGSMLAMPQYECALVDPAVSTEAGSVDTVGVPTTTACPQPEPPAGVPSEDEARQLTLAALTALGVDSDSVDVEVYADEWSANATVFPLLDGARTSMAWSFGYGENGAITWASGSLATPEFAADYPLIGCAAGVDRLNNQNDAWMTGGVTPMAKGTAMSGYGATADAAVAAPEPMPVEEMPVEEIPIEELTVDTTPVVVTFTACRLDRMMQWDADGTVWLLPAYTYTASDGGEYTVIAIGDEYIAPVETVETVPAPDTTPTPDTTVPVVPVDTIFIEDLVGAPTVAGAEILVGLPLDEASKVAEENSWTVRALRIDGVDQAATMDYRTDRVNVALVDGVVTEIIDIG